MNFHLLWLGLVSGTCGQESSMALAWRWVKGNSNLNWRQQLLADVLLLSRALEQDVMVLRLCLESRGTRTIPNKPGIQDKMLHGQDVSQGPPEKCSKLCVCVTRTECIPFTYVCSIHIQRFTVKNWLMWLWRLVSWNSAGKACKLETRRALAWVTGIFDRASWLIGWALPPFPTVTEDSALKVHHLILITGGTTGKELASQSRRHKEYRLYPWVRRIPCWREWQPTPWSGESWRMPGESHGQRKLGGYSS